MCPMSLCVYKKKASFSPKSTELFQSSPLFLHFNYFSSSLNRIQLKTYTLYELNEFLRRVVAMNFPESVWVTAETIHISWSRGHCYLDLVEKNADSSEIEAKMLAIMWAGDFKRICRARHAESNKDEDLIQSEIIALLKSGMNIRIKVRADFSELHGIKLIVEELDFTQIAGNQAVERLESIRYLKNSGAMHRNKKLKAPVSWQRIAVISSETAAGWEDFQAHLQQNPLKFTFELTLFKAAMQGIYLQNEIIGKLNAIALLQHKFDAIVIVRGGGSKTDLGGFDNKLLCEAASHAPLPLLTGIGHEIDESILDMIAFKSLKTPTAVADFLIEQQREYHHALMQAQRKAQLIVNQRIEQSFSLLQRQKMQMQWIGHHYIAQQTQHLTHLSKMLQTQHPQKLAEQGYVLIEKNGKRVINSESIHYEDLIKIYFKDSVINAQVIDKK
jgi:exodeoxyribonuclease VII large subunit